MENGAIRYSRQETANIPPSWVPCWCTKKLRIVTTAARTSTMSAMRRTMGRASDVRRVSQTVASWTTSTIEAARASSTETDTT